VNQPTNRAIVRACASVIEVLEDRRLLSSSLTNGTLRIAGTSRADVITVKTSGTTGLRISDNGVVSRFN
jgi:hypothetical protein